MMKRITAALFAALIAFPALAQQIDSGTLLGNDRATAGPPRQSTPGALLDRAYSAVNGTVLCRSGGVWNDCTTPVLGIPGTSIGTLGFAGNTSGTVTVTPQAAAGTPTITWPNTSGTVAVGASSPLVLNATTGALTCPTCFATTSAAALTRVDDTNVTLTLGGSPSTALVNAASITVGWTGTLGLTRGGCGRSLTASAGGIVWTDADSCEVLAGTATANQMLRSGNTATPNWSTAVWPGTTSAGTVLVSATANTVTATATPTLGVAGTTLGSIALAGNTSGTVTIQPLAAAGGYTLTLPPNDGGVNEFLQTNGSGVLTWAAAGGTGTVTSVTCNGVTITTTGTCPPNAGLQNHSLAVSAAGSALTIALKDSAGSDPSASSPVNGWFRNATGTTGSWTQLTVTAATSLTVSSGSTLGIASSVAFRLWVVLFNDAGTARLGVINCYDGNVDIYPLQPGQVASSTAEGGAGAADSSGVFYTGTAVTSKAYHIVGYIEWNTSGITAGTWTTSNVNVVTAFGPGVPLPGHTVQHRRNHVGSLATGTTTVPADNTIPQITEGDQYMTQAITPTSAANMLKITARAQLTSSATGQMAMALFQDATSNALATSAFAIRTADDNFMQMLQWCMRSMTTSSTTFRIRAGLNNAGTTTFNGVAATAQYGGTMNSFMEAMEIMT